MNAGYRILATTALALLLSAAAASAFGDEGEVTVDTETIDLEDAAKIVVSSQVPGAAVSVNRHYAGKVTYTSGPLEPGNYLIEVSKSGYYTLSYFIVLEENTEYDLHFSLALITGFLSVTVQPPDAELLVDGSAIRGSFVELPIGPHGLTARRFGYEERRESVVILERLTTEARISLPLAAFSVTAPEPGRTAFNPANAGVLGTTEIEFSATSYGSARLEIRDREGELVAERDFPSLETWKQSFAWDGHGPDHRTLPDGDYDISLVAMPASGVPILSGGPGVGPGGSVSRAARVRIDSSIVIRALNSMAAVPGLLLFPDPSPQPAGVLAAELCWLSPGTGPEGSAFAFGGTLSLGGMAVIGLSAAAETADPEGDADLGLSVLLPYAHLGHFAGAFFIRGSWSSAEDPLLPGSVNGIEAALPLSLRLGRLLFGASPGFFAAIDPTGTELAPLVRAGAWVAEPAFRIGLSGELALGGADGILSPSWPARACAEARVILVPSSLVAAGYLLAKLEPGSAPSWAFGLGLGLLL
jgi:hypothetical protein